MFWDSAQYFHSKQLRKSFEKNIFTKIWPVWMKKSKKLFSNKYCNPLVHASLTKFTGPAKLFLKKKNTLFLKKM